MTTPIDLVRVPGNNEAKVNVTWRGNNFDLVDFVDINLSDSDIRLIVEESVRNGGIPGVPRDQSINLTDFIVDRFPVNDQRDYRLYAVRPKTPFGVGKKKSKQAATKKERAVPGAAGVHRLKKKGLCSTCRRQVLSILETGGFEHAIEYLQEEFDV